jgi:hypothetical protein
MVHVACTAGTFHLRTAPFTLWYKLLRASGARKCSRASNSTGGRRVHDHVFLCSVAFVQGRTTPGLLRAARARVEAYGKADVEGDVPTTVDTVYPIGSVTKHFTAAAILQLRDQGKLSLDDEITKWPRYGTPVRQGRWLLHPQAAVEGSMEDKLAASRT